MATLFPAPRHSEARPEQQGDDFDLPPSGFGWRNVWLTVAVGTADEPAVRGRCKSRRWVVRALEARADGSARPVRLRVEVWVNGARRRACNEAQHQFEALLADRPAVRVVQAALAPKAGVEAVGTWHMSREPTWRGNALTEWIRDAWMHSGGLDEPRMVHLQEGGSREEAEALFQQDDGGGAPFDPGVHYARRALGPAAPGTRAGQHRRRRSIAVLAGSAVWGLLLIALGWIAPRLPWQGQAAMTAPLIVAAWLLGSWATSNAERPWTVRFATGALLVFGPAGSAYMLSIAKPQGALSEATALVIAGILVFGVWGSWYACKFSRIARNAVALSPVLVLPLPWVVPFVAQTLHSVYLDAFGIPTSAVNVDPVYTYFIALKPVAVGACALLVSLGLAGLARYHYWPAGGKVTSLTLAGCIAATYLVTTLDTATQQVHMAAVRTAQAAVDGHDPTGYFGLDGQLLCVSAVVDRPAVENGPLPTGHRVLVFDRSGDDLWLWDPKRAVSPGGPAPALHVKAEHITTWVPADNRSCSRTTVR